MSRVTFLVDGFNIYHSTKKASWDLKLDGKGTKWLDLNSLLSDYLHRFGGGSQIEEIFYFSALAKHLDSVAPGKTARHKQFIKCLESTGVIVELFQFKSKEVSYKQGNIRITIYRYEEKETDVAIGSRLLELLHEGRCDHAVLVTGDSDLTPAIETARRLFPAIPVSCIFPFKSKSARLSGVVSNHFTIKPRDYAAHQFPNPVTLADGTTIAKPVTW